MKLQTKWRIPMQVDGRTESDTQSIAKKLQATIGEVAVDRVARECGFAQRKRDVTPLALLVACISTLVASQARWLADILRTFNRFTGKAVEYKPFHNQLAKESFPEFIRLVLEEALGQLTMPVLTSVPHDKISIFKDIVLQDGSSMAVKDSLAGHWPGRFRKVSPAAVELHVTMSGLKDNPISITLTADKESERAEAPAPADLEGCLLLEDRGYQSRQVFKSIDQHGGFFIVRGTKNIRPTIRRAYDVRGRRLRQLEGKRLSWKRLPRNTRDLDIEWGSARDVYRGRVVVFHRRGKRNQKTFTYLHTNLARKLFSAVEVGQLYRLRWQVELLFKEWKSHANLHRFDTSKAPIAEGLIWASLLATLLTRAITHAAERLLGVEMSTQRVAASARHFLDSILESLLSGGRTLRRVLKEAFAYLNDNARRAHPERDRRKGRLATGLRPTAVLKN